VHDASFKQERQSRKSNVWMWQNIHLLPLVQLDRSHVIDENERANHALLAKRKESTDQKFPDIGSSLFDDKLDVGHLFFERLKMNGLI
jgi:hypothetical protein